MLIVVSDLGIIAASIISLIGMILIFMINNNNWFKRQNFKLQATNIKAENKLKLKKLERDLGISHSKNTGSDKEALSFAPESTNLLASLAPILKNLDGDQLKDLADRFLPQAEEYEPEGLAGTLLNFAEDNPEIVEGLLKGLSGKQDQIGGSAGEY